MQTKGKTRPQQRAAGIFGDSVLSVIVAKHLFLKYKDIPEGELTKLRASLVCEKALDVFAQQLGLGEYLRLGKGEEMTGGRSRPSILADAFEAVIAALYLDGGYQAAQKFVLSFIPENLDVKAPINWRIIKRPSRKSSSKTGRKKLNTSWLMRKVPTTPRCLPPRCS